jgi:serine/threonine protein kinase
MPAHLSILELIAAAQDARNVYTITEYCGGGEFFDFIKNNGALDEPTARLYFRQIVEGLAHMKQTFVVHRDLSLENILLTTDQSACKIM